MGTDPRTITHKSTLDLRQRIYYNSMKEKSAVFGRLEVSDNELQEIRNLIYRWTAINISDRKKGMIASRLFRRLRHYDFKSMKQYINLVSKPENTEEKQVFINLITTNETYFFREEIHFEYLQNVLQKVPDAGHKIRLWSAACSTGEEAYSMAMIAAEAFGISGNWEIIASDINDEVLATGRAGVYGMERISDLPIDFLRKYCLKGKNKYENKLRIIEELRNKITFRQENLDTLTSDLGIFTVIFFRNALIYFDDAKKKQITENVTKHLEKGGYLVVSLTENLRRVTNSLLAVGESYYQYKDRKSEEDITFF